MSPASLPGSHDVLAWVPRIYEYFPSNESRKKYCKNLKKKLILIHYSLWQADTFWQTAPCENGLHGL